VAGFGVASVWMNIAASWPRNAQTSPLLGASLELF
jgi:hypothetical protein